MVTNDASERSSTGKGGNEERTSGPRASRICHVHTLAPRSLIMGQKQTSDNALGHDPTGPNHQIPTHEPPRRSFALASTLFQRDHCQRFSVWSHPTLRQNQEDEKAGDDIMEEDDWMDKEEDEVEAWLVPDDEICTDYGDSDFAPTARLQL